MEDSDKVKTCVDCGTMIGSLMEVAVDPPEDGPDTLLMCQRCVDKNLQNGSVQRNA